jgi:hypothetical protein
MELQLVLILMCCGSVMTIGVLRNTFDPFAANSVRHPE